MNKCRHFRGIQHKTCEAGVELAPLRDASGSGMARWPCLVHGGREAATTCEKRSFLTAEERRAEYAKLEAAIVTAEAGTCPTCGSVLTVREGGGAIVKTCSAHGFVMRGCKAIDD